MMRVGAFEMAGRNIGLSALGSASVTRDRSRYRPPPPPLTINVTALGITLHHRMATTEGWESSTCSFLGLFLVWITF